VSNDCGGVEVACQVAHSNETVSKLGGWLDKTCLIDVGGSRSHRRSRTCTVRTVEETAASRGYYGHVHQVICAKDACFGV